MSHISIEEFDALRKEIHPDLRPGKTEVSVSIEVVDREDSDNCEIKCCYLLLLEW
jgi:hypothetical protein